MLKKIVLLLLVIFIVIQFFRPKRNESVTASPQDIGVMYPMHDSVRTILQKACFDCHSNNTRYPWYNNMQPVAWFMDHHINEAREHLNFSEFGSYPAPKQVKKLKKVAQSIQEGWMPLNSYTWIHKDAILTDAEKNTIIDWSVTLSNQIAAKGN